MKVIFLEDVSGVARAGQTREVADGYARNYLLPRKLAVQSSSQASAAVEVQLKKIARQRALEEAEMAEMAKKLDGMEITLKARAGEKERLYGSVTGADIAEALGERVGHEVDKRKIELEEPIRQLGSYDVTVKFTHDITAVVKVMVLSDEVTAEKSEKAEKTEKKTKAKKKKKEEKEAEAKVEEAEAEPKE